MTKTYLGMGAGLVFTEPRRGGYLGRRLTGTQLCDGERTYRAPVDALFKQLDGLAD
ncbi:hypothetical protein ACIRP0_11460 [Streptomyces sp. NPDC101733]|uniref:hypothetical protein n=1 Tax=unclassified Streptomyces TaxID=2593676 RepID=UPI0037FFF83D